jgi:two-component system, NtrC family, sensor kinase
MSAFFAATMSPPLAAPAPAATESGPDAMRDTELAALRAQLACAQDQLRHADRIGNIGHLAAGVVHEISNPLGCVLSNFTIVQGYIDDLLRIMQDGERSQWGAAGACREARLQALRNESELALLRHDLPLLMEETRTGITRVRAALDALKDFARSGGGKAWAWVDLNDAVDAALRLGAGLLRQRADVVRDFGELPPIFCMPDELHQVILNLLINAVHAIDTRGTITVRTGVDKRQVWLSVTDTGAGIAAEHLSRVFDPFFTTKPPGTGTGLGLSLARTIVVRHDGQISVDSSAGKGTTFRVVLPIGARGNGRSEALAR